MTVFPLDTPKRGLPYVLLSEALDSGQLKISEVSDRGSVPVVKVTNRGSKPVLMIDGEELVGYKQNRMLNSTVLVPPHSTIDVPVSCIERARWNSVSGRFRVGEMPHMTLRRMKARQVAKGLRTHGTRDSDQSAVWEEVSRIQLRYGVSSQTEALHDVFDARRVELDGYAKALKVNAKGVAICVNGKVKMVEVFDKKSTLKKMLPKLIRGAAVDAMVVQEEVYVEPSKKDVEAFWQMVRRGRWGNSIPLASRPTCESRGRCSSELVSFTRRRSCTWSCSSERGGSPERGREGLGGTIIA